MAGSSLLLQLRAIILIGFLLSVSFLSHFESIEIAKSSFTGDELPQAAAAAANPRSAAATTIVENKERTTTPPAALALPKHFCPQCQFDPSTMGKIKCIERAIYFMTQYKDSAEKALVAVTQAQPENCQPATTGGEGVIDSSTALQLLRQAVVSPPSPTLAPVSKTKTLASPVPVENATSPLISSQIPSLNSILGGDNNKKIVGDPQSLFHFAIVGFAKCGTSSLLKWLWDHPDTCIAQGDNGELNFLRKRPVKQIREMHQRATSTACRYGAKINGYKNPHDVQYPQCLNFFRRYTPQTKLIVIIRHPVRFFESFYNYRIVKGENWAIAGEPNELIGGKDQPPYRVWSYSGAFHRYLVMLGKTQVDTAEERSLLEAFMHPTTSLENIPLLPNPVFIVENSQLSDPDPGRRERLASDLQEFLGLPHPLPSEIPKANTLARQRKGVRPLNICLGENSMIRQDTLNVARKASLWIRRYFLQSSDVHVSSREYFETLLESWMHDPCGNSTI